MMEEESFGMLVRQSPLLGQNLLLLLFFLCALEEGAFRLQRRIRIVYVQRP